MSRAVACEIVKVLATRKRVSVAQIQQVVGGHESNIREWLYEMRAQGLVRRTDQTIMRFKDPNVRGRGKYEQGIWEWIPT